MASTSIAVTPLSTSRLVRRRFKHLSASSFRPLEMSHRGDSDVNAKPRGKLARTKWHHDEHRNSGDKLNSHGDLLPSAQSTILTHPAKTSLFCCECSTHASSPEIAKRDDAVHDTGKESSKRSWRDLGQVGAHGRFDLGSVTLKLNVRCRQQSRQ